MGRALKMRESGQNVANSEIGVVSTPSSPTSKKGRLT